VYGLRHRFDLVDGDCDPDDTARHHLMCGAVRTYR
jgi:hypothetical protein